VERGAPLQAVLIGWPRLTRGTRRGSEKIAVVSVS